MVLPLLYYSVILINVIVFLSGKKIKSIYIPSYLFLILFAMGKRTSDSFLTYDLSNYRYKYETFYDYFTLEIGYKCLISLSNSIGLSFDSFHGCLMCLIFLFMLFAIKRIGGNPHLIIFCWLSYFIIITTSHLRNQCALSIMMLTIFPFYTNKLKSKYWVLSGLLLSILFHVSFVAFLIPLMLCYINNDNIKFMKLWFTGNMMVFTFLMFSSVGESLNSFFVVLDFMGDLPTKYEGYTESHTGYSSLLSLAIYLLLLCSIFNLKKSMIRFKGKGNKYVYENIDMLFMFVLYSSCLLPLLLINNAFYRFFRDISFITIAYLGINSTIKAIPMSKRLKIFFVALTITVGWFLFDIVIKGYWPEYTQQFFNINILGV